MTASLSRMTTTECPWLPLLDPPGEDLRPDPDMITTAAEFTAAMRRYHLWAGNASFRDLEARCRHRVSASAFCAVLKQDSLPRLELLREFLFACGTYDDYGKRFIYAWHRVAATSLPQSAASQALSSAAALAVLAASPVMTRPRAVSRLENAGSFPRVPAASWTLAQAGDENHWFSSNADVPVASLSAYWPRRPDHCVQIALASFPSVVDGKCPRVSGARGLAEDGAAAEADDTGGAGDDVAEEPHAARNATAAAEAAMAGSFTVL